MAGKEMGRKCCRNFLKGGFLIIFFSVERKQGQAACAGTHLPPKHQCQAAERRFQLSKSSLALCRSLSLPEEIILLVRYISAPRCSSW